MASGNASRPGCGVEFYLDEPITCALYLNDALEARQISGVVEALRDIRRANGSKVRPLRDGQEMTLTEVMDVLEGAGIRLVAVPAPSPPTEAAPESSVKIRKLGG